MEDKKEEAKEEEEDEREQEEDKRTRRRGSERRRRRTEFKERAGGREAGREIHITHVCLGSVVTSVMVTDC